LPKIDILHHRAYDQLQKLFELTGTKPADGDYQDPAVYTVFEQLDTCGIPEFASDFTKGLLAQLGRIRFSELVSVSGMAHGTDAWNGNGEYLIKEHPICELISTRDDVFLTLRKFDVPRERAVIAMKHTRMGKYHNDTGSKREMFDYLRWVGVPDWYLESMERIWYLFPKAHAAHYTKLAVSLAWFKHYYPKEFYQVLLSGDDNEELLLCSNEELKRQLSLLDSSSYKERDAIKLLLEARQRGYIPIASTSK
jgi:DNA polymerase-3 subunit alpha (Gram-positive type)